MHIHGVSSGLVVRRWIGFTLAGSLAVRPPENGNDRCKKNQYSKELRFGRRSFAVATPHLRPGVDSHAFCLDFAPKIRIVVLHGFGLCFCGGGAVSLYVENHEVMLLRHSDDAQTTATINKTTGIARTITFIQLADRTELRRLWIPAGLLCSLAASSRFNRFGSFIIITKPSWSTGDRRNGP